MATLYYVDYPRDFANEYDVFAVAPEDRAAFERVRPDAERINRPEAIRLGWTRRREAKRDGEQWFGGFFQGWGHPADTLDEVMEECRKQTAGMVATAEAEAACEG